MFFDLLLLKQSADLLFFANFMNVENLKATLKFVNEEILDCFAEFLP